MFVVRSVYLTTYLSLNTIPLHLFIAIHDVFHACFSFPPPDTVCGCACTLVKMSCYTIVYKMVT